MGMTWKRMVLAKTWSFGMPSMAAIGFMMALKPPDTKNT